MSAFVQWKGTDICMDFHCPRCEGDSHFDGMFAYNIQCPRCKGYFKMPDHIEPIPLPAKPDELILYACPDDD